MCGEAENGKEAVTKANELKPDVIILDISMPLLSGLEAAREIRKTLPGTPIMFLSMHESRSFIDVSRSVGVQGFVSKTEAGSTLLRAVDAVLRGEMFFPEDHVFNGDSACESFQEIMN